ncbi:hypothetical protein Mlab_1717 [Methanocorpusculum labreanum Z]|uniref:DUF3821 domain-containing protein n=1 Tax=Methanocorpusculum labreanum (strain ATCC 43576 / DSM 4855 / Z) TaxID=410358 RepID=A2SU72_METLZ|nr:hypothetical protein [Methanocorpusculum labreanum]ABN07878.1 hypothetical protein Mlab_1717 [Methanocorpusculum labreanum Z]
MNKNTKKHAESNMQHAWKILLVLLCVGLFVGAVSAATTTSVEISRIAADGTTVLANETVTYEWIKENLPIAGDGITHYGHQGPVFEEASGYYGDPWDPQEIINTDDAGALRGTSVLDLASLVGEIPENSTVKIIASDGFSQTFSSGYLISPTTEMGPLVLVWEVNGVNVSAAGSSGDASDGMRVYFFADDGVFGNYDMFQTMPEGDWYNYSTIYPSTRGLSVRSVDRIKIYTEETEYNPTPTVTPTITPTVTPTVTPTPKPEYDLSGFDRVVTIDTSQITIPAAALGSSSTLKTDTTAGNNSVAAMVYNTFGSDVTFWKGGQTGNKFNLDTLLGKTHKSGGYWHLFVDSTEQSISSWATDLTVTSGQVVELVYESDTVGVENFTVRMEASEDPMYIYDNVVDIGKTGTFTETINDVQYQIPWYSPAGVLKSLDFDTEYLVRQNGNIYFNSFTDLQTGIVYADDYINVYNAADLSATLPADAEILPGDVIYIQFGGNKYTIEGSTAVIRAEIYAPGKTATWPLYLNGAVDIPLDKDYFEADASTHARVTYTDGNGDVWSGVPLRILTGMVDDIEANGVSHYTFNATRAAAGYTITFTNGDGTTASVNADVLPATRNSDMTYTDAYLIADTLNGVKTALTFVGSAVPAKLTDVRTINMDVSAFEPVEENWSIDLFGNINGTLADTFLYEAVDSGCAPTHNITYTDTNGDVYFGMGMSTFLGWVDDEHPHALASETLSGGVTITFANSAGDSTTIDSDIFKDDTKKAIIAIYKNGEKITPTFIGEVVGLTDRISGVSTITFTNYRAPPEIEGLTIIKKTADGTIINQTYISWQEMRDTFPVIGDGTYNYSIQGPIMPDYIGEYGNWDEDEQFPPCGTADDPRFKVNDQVKGTAIINLTDLVGGMSEGDQLKITASDGKSETFVDGYRYIYNPDARMGTMFLAWSDDGIDGPTGYDILFRLFMTSDDNIFSLWDMHESMAEEDWGFYAGLYPTPADFSVYKINKLEIIVSETDVTYEYTADTGQVEIPASVISGSDVPKTVANNSLIGAVYNTLDGAELFYKVGQTATYFNLNSYDGHIHKSPGKWYAYINDAEVTESEWDKVTVTGGETVRLLYDDSTNGKTYNYSIKITAPNLIAAVIKGNVTIPADQITAGVSKEVDNASVIGVLYNTLPGVLFYYGGDTTTYFNIESYDGNTHKIPTKNDKWYLSVNGVTLGKTEPDWSLITVEDGDVVSLMFDNQTAGTVSYFNMTVETVPVGTILPITDGDVIVPAADISGSDIDVNVPGSSLIGVLSGIDGIGFFKGGNQGAYFNLDSYDGHTHKSPTKNDKWYVYIDGVEVTESNWTNVTVYDDQVIRLFFDEASTGNSYEYLFTTKGGTTAGWSVKLINGETETILSQSEFETLATKYTAYPCTDENGVWNGVPLYVLAGIVDDDDASSFNEVLAGIGYSIRVTDSQATPYSTNFDSAVIANDNSIIVANTLNGDPIPELTTAGKPCAPLQMKGVSAGQLIGNIGTIELIDVPEDGNLLFLSGKMQRYLTQEQYDGSNHHFVTYGDYEGMPLYTLVATIDDVEAGIPGTYSGSHFTLNTSIISTSPYTILITSTDGQTREIPSSEIASGKTGALNYIIAQKADGSLVLTGNSVSTIFENVKSIELKGDAYQGDDWYILLDGPEFGVYLSKAEIEEAVGCEWHYKTFTDPYTGEVWSGMTLASLVGYVDDTTMPVGSNHGGSFNLQLAENGYTIILTAADGYSAEVDSKDLANNKNGYIIANKVDGEDLFKSDNLKENKYPLRLVGSGTYLDTGDANTSKFTSIAVGGLVKIELKEFAPETESPKLTIEKYDTAGNIIASEEVLWSDIWADPATYPVIGDGVTVYAFQGLVMEEEGEKIGQGVGWDLDEKYLTGNYKVSNAVKGTAVQNLTDLVGGMNTTDEIKFICSLDGWTTTLNYTNIYTPTVRQGTAFLAWYADGKTIPEYSQGPRLYFTSDDNVFSHADMYYSLDESYWHYNSGRASAGGISAQMVDVIKIIPKADSWTINLNGAINATIDKGYFESGLTCTFANGTVSDHQAYYTDSKGRVWAGMPLWILTGFVDDENSHTGNSYNRTLALKGYNITVVSDDGSEVIIDSRDAYMSNNYIVANTLNGSILEEDDGWPLRLVGANVTGDMQIKGIEAINLDLQPVAEKELEYNDTVVLRNTTLSLDVGGTKYDVASNTVLGVILEAGLEPVIGTKKWDIAGILLFDGLTGYESGDTAEWTIMVNNETTIDGYNDATKNVAVNIYEVKPGDVITGKFLGNDGVTVSQEFVITVTDSGLDYDQTVVLRDTTLSLDVSGTTYDVTSNTVLGVILEAGLEPVIGTKKWDIAGILLFDGLTGYESGDTAEWTIMVNNETTIDGYNDATKNVAVNIYEVKPGDVITGTFSDTTTGNVIQEFTITVTKPDVLTISGPSTLISGIEGTYSLECENAARITVNFGDGTVTTYTATDGAVVVKHTYTTNAKQPYTISAAAYNSAGTLLKNAEYSVTVEHAKLKPADPVVTNGTKVITQTTGNATQISGITVDESDLISPGAVPAILVVDNSSSVPANGDYGQLPENAGLLAVLNISLTNITNPDNLNYTATFQVFLDKTAVNQLTGNDPTKITAYRNTLIDGAWVQVPLKTSYNQTADTATEYAYDVETPGFSYFTFAAVAASSPVSSTNPPSSGGDTEASGGSSVTSTTTVTPTSIPTTASPTQTQSTPTQTQTSTPTSVPTTASPTQTQSPVPFAGLLAGLGIGALILRRK